MSSLPTGTVSFLFSDIEGSTRLLDELGADNYSAALAEHRRVMRDAFVAHGGVEVDTQGDAFFVAFPEAAGALAAAEDVQAALEGGPIRVRIGLHTGTPLLTSEGYIGIDVHRGARVMSAGHGGQVLVSETTYALLDGAERLTDLGLHRLKDLTEPQRLWQLGNSEFPPLKTLYQTNLPVQPTPLVGREGELAEVLELLEGSRLLTLTGAGGSGKTRLGLQAAAELVGGYRDGVWWVSLAALRDPELVEPTITQVVGAKDGLADYLRSKQALLLLDNFEHLLPAAAVVATLLREAPDLCMLATSRERLGIAAEQEYVVPTLLPSEALALFTARARRLKPHFEPDNAVGEICRRLDGLPLAIELAAARIKVLRPEQIVQRLGRSLDVLAAGARDAPERQQTLRATIDWSYELLDEDEQRVFACLAVFAGSFDIDAAEAVSDADLETLAALVDKSLLRQVEGGRFFMLETIREFAAGKLEQETAGQTVHARHAAWYAALASDGDILDGGVERLDSLERDLDNFRTAMTWSLEVGDAGDALAIALGLSQLWELRDLWYEGASWYERVAAKAPDGSLERARVLCEHAPLLMHLGEWEAVERLLDEARPGMLSSPSPRDRGRWWLLRSGPASMGRGDPASAVRSLESALGEFRAAGDVLQERVTAHHLGETLRELGDLQRAAEWLLRSIELSRALDDSIFEAASVHGLGDVWLELGDDERAEKAYADSLRASHAARFEGQTVLSLAALAATAARRGELERAGRLWASVEAYEHERRTRLHEHERRRYEAALADVSPRDPLQLDEAVAFALADSSPR